MACLAATLLLGRNWSRKSICSSLLILLSEMVNFNRNSIENHMAKWFEFRFELKWSFNSIALAERVRKSSR